MAQDESSIMCTLFEVSACILQNGNWLGYTLHFEVKIKHATDIFRCTVLAVCSSNLAIVHTDNFGDHWTQISVCIYIEGKTLYIVSYFSH